MTGEACDVETGEGRSGGDSRQGRQVDFNGVAAASEEAEIGGSRGRRQQREQDKEQT